MIHASIGFPGAFWGWFTSKLVGVPFVFTEHTRISNNFRSAFHKQCTLRPLARASRVMAVSSSLAKEMRPWLNQEAIVVPNMIDVVPFSHLELDQSETPQIGLLGGFNTPVKGLDILLQALANVKRDFILHIGGSGSLEGSYKSLAQELGIASKCRFYGFIPYAEVPQFMSRLHFFVCSSRYETFCVSLIEAMASGRPVVSTRCGGPEDFVNETNGVLCDKENPEALQKAIEWMMSNYSSFSSVTMKAYIEDNFTGGSFLKKIGEVYSEVLR
jgi:glycosyltransferase involved in cell wall biosynthesis